MSNIVLFIFLIFKLILQLSIISILPITVVIIMNKFLKNRMAFKFQYILYLLILLRLLVPMMPKTSLSIFNSLKIDKQKDAVVDVLTTDNVDNQFYNNNFDFSKLNKDMSIYTTNIKLFHFNKNHMFILWLLVAILLALYNIIAYVRFHKKVNLTKTLKDDYLEFLSNNIKTTLNISKNFNIIELDFINSPAIFGIKAPTILLPKGLLKNLKPEDLKNILFHELCHYKRKDMIPIYLSKLISIIYWFNPLVIYALKELKKSLELSCDEMVLSYIGQEKNLSYGYTIINLINHTKNSMRPTIALTMMGNKNQTAHRIKFIRDFKKKGILSRVLSLTIIILISLMLLTESLSVASAHIDNEVSWKYVVDKNGILKKEDNINIPFEDDDRLLGKWVSVDFVPTINDFNPNNKRCRCDLYLKNLEFLPNGKTPFNWYRWTKNIIIHSGDKTASRYYIKNINGIDYMFYQWKSGDYSFRNMTPMYYVLKREKNS